MAVYLVRPRGDREEQLAGAGYYEPNMMQLAIVRATSEARSGDLAVAVGRRLLRHDLTLFVDLET